MFEILLSGVLSLHCYMHGCNSHYKLTLWYSNPKFQHHCLSDTPFSWSWASCTQHMSLRTSQWYFSMSPALILTGSKWVLVRTPWHPSRPSCPPLCSLLRSQYWVACNAMSLNLLLFTCFLTFCFQALLVHIGLEVLTAVGVLSSGIYRSKIRWKWTNV